MDPVDAKVSPAGAGQLVERAVAAALAGIILPFVQFGWLLLVAALSHETRCGHFGCIGLLIDAWTVSTWAMLVLAWPLLHLLRVRPAWPVAVLAPFFLVPLWELVDMPISVISGLFAYPLAAVACAARMSWRRRALILALFLIVCAFFQLSR